MIRDLGVDVRNPLSEIGGLNPKAATQPSKYRLVNQSITVTAPEIAFLTP